MAGRSTETKRKRKSSAKNNEPTPTYHWVGKGTPQNDGTVDYNDLEILVDGHREALVSVGDSVLLRSGNDSTSEEEEESSVEYDPFVARVEKMWQEPAANNKGGKESDEDRSMRMKMRARWFFKKDDVAGLGGTFVGMSRQDLISTMTSRDLFLGNHTDDNEVPTILDKCLVLRRRPEERSLEHLPQGAYVCRYDITIQAPKSNGLGTVTITPYDGEDEEVGSGSGDANERPKKRSRTRGMSDSERRGSPHPESEMSNAKGKSSLSDQGSASSARKSSGNRASSVSSGNHRMASEGANEGDNNNEAFNSYSDDEDESVTSTSSSSSQKQDEVKPQETEGRTTHGRIQIGPEYQVEVPPFAGPGKSRSRNPSVVWKPNAASDEILDNFFADAAKILSSYMDQHGLVSRSPYGLAAPGSIRLQKEAPHGWSAAAAMTNTSTGSSLGSDGNKRLELTRECNVDKLLALLHDKAYDTNAALKAVSSSPRDYLTIWNKQEKELFNNGFRRYCGSLRMISKGVASTKSFKDVVDYHYRFKIPDQFRRYQEKKREQAHRMMECVESRRFRDSLLHSRDENARGVGTGSGSGAGGAKKVRDWSRTGGTDSIGATEERRVEAKELLVQVRSVIGEEKFSQLADALKEYQHSIPQLKEAVGDLLKNQTDLMERFLEYLPKKFRS